MSLKIITILLVLTQTLVINGEFPQEPKPCKYGDTECIKATMNFLFKDKSDKGDASLNFQQLNPLLIDALYIQQGKESPVSLDLKLKNCNMYGLETAKAVKVKGFGKDLTKKHSILIHSDYISVVGGYDIDGKILILPIKGSGAANLTMVDVNLAMNFVGTPVEKDGATYMNVEQLNINVDPKRMIYKVDNLFNGDKALGDNMNLFLNENWQEIFTEVRGSLNKAFSEVYIKVINEVFSKYPYDKYFSE